MVAETTSFSVVAIIAAFNEEDIIGQVVGDLVNQGIGVYLLDHGSTDGTLAAVEPYRARGVLGIERFPPDGVPVREESGRFTWEQILRRKEAIACELNARWFIHHDADEFRESPWWGVNLFDGIRRVDEAGYNAIDFELLNFWPTHDHLRPGDDVRQAFPFYEHGQAWDRVQIRCWKKLGIPADLASTGGHEARFPDRQVFPIRFILRHYPIRSQAHGVRKVFLERRPRFLRHERDRGWHVQYDAVREGESFLRDPTTLTPWDPVAARVELSLRHRGAEHLEDALAAERRVLSETRAQLAETEARLVGLEHDLRTRAAEADRIRFDLEAQTAEVERLRRDLDRRTAEAIALQSEVHTQRHEIEGLGVRLSRCTEDSAALQRVVDARGADLQRVRDELDQLRRRLEDVYTSLSWRWTAPFRSTLRRLRGY